MKIKLTPYFGKPVAVNFPDDFNSLSYKQACRLAELIHSNTKTSAMLLFFFYVARLKVCTANSFALDDGTKVYFVKRRWRRGNFFIADTELAQIVRATSWMFDKDENFVSGLTAMPKNKFINIDPALTGISFDQFCHADTHFQMFVQTGETEHLDKLICALKAKPFESDQYLINIDKIRKHNQWEKVVVFWYYAGCKKLLTLVFKELFSHSDHGDPKEAPSDPYMQFMALTSNMCESPAEISTVKKQLAWDVFSYLDEKIKASNKLTEKTPSNGTNS